MELRIIYTILYGISVILIICQAQIDDAVYDCTAEHYSCGPIPPVVPESFILKYEEVDLKKNTTSWAEQYFDPINLRAKYMYVKEGTEFHYLFDYDVNQIVFYMELHPGASPEMDPLSKQTCVSTDMKYDQHSTIFGYLYKHRYTKRSRMYQSYQVLHFGGQFQYAYKRNETIVDRGVTADVFHGCFKDDSSLAVMDKTFYWSDADVNTPTNEATVPLKTESNTVYTVYPNNDGVPQKQAFSEIENVAWFEEDPEFDEKIFQIPRGMFCNDYAEVKQMPNIPDAFSLRLEMVSITRDSNGKQKGVGTVWNKEIWYDYNSNIARVDYVLTVGDNQDLVNLFQLVPISAVFDVSNGVVYYTNKATGACVPFDIESDHSFLSKNSQRRLKTPQELIGFDPNKMGYKGKDFIRNVHCDVWASQMAINTNETVFLEIYFSTEGWHEESDEDEEFNIPLRFTEINYVTENNTIFEVTSEFNIFKFKEVEPPLSAYDISSCIIDQEKKYLQFEFSSNDKDLLPKDHEQFLQAVRQSVLDNSRIGSVFRIQDVEVYVPQGKSNIKVSLVLLDSPKLFGKTSKQPGTSLTAAIANLKKAINTGDFNVLVVVDPNAECVNSIGSTEDGNRFPETVWILKPQKKNSVHKAESIRAVPNSLIEIFSQSEAYKDDDGKDTEITEENNYSEILDDNIPKVTNLIYQFADPKPTSTGYSPVSLAMLAIGMLVIGIAIGIGLMYFYFKKYGTSQENAIIMQEQ